MPVRIYDIAKKLGITNKEVIARAKDLGITNARVPSSSLDKITAEYLEQQIAGPPESEVVSATAETPADEGIVIVTAPEEEPAAETSAETVAADQSETAEATALTPAEATASGTAEADATTDSDAGEDHASDSVVAETANDLKPDELGLGAKVGFIHLPKGMQGRSRADGKGRDKQNSGRKGHRKDPRGSTDAHKTTLSTEESISQPARPKPKYVAPLDAKLLSLKQPIIVRDLAKVLNRKPFQLIADLMELNVFATVNQAIDEFTAKQICAKHGFRFEIEKREKGAGVTRQLDTVDLDVDDKEGDLITRPPVVTIMGHVDHGKTTLLDVIRKSNVVSGEAGGITQHIGAYTIHFPHPERSSELQQITFLDTPGHAAFSAMRARGANITDLVILVVAANDGVKPQTIEALNHAKAARVPIIVGVNKIDLPSASPLNTRQQLQDYGLVCEEWGGDTIFVDVSALKVKGIDTLLEMVLLQSEVLELQANPNRPAVGNVIESGMQQGGPIATVLVRKGTLKIGDAMLCGFNWGRIKALINEDGKRLKRAGPSVAVRVLGLNGAPEAGLEFNILPNEKQARKLAEERAQQTRQEIAERRNAVTLENLFDTLSSDSVKTLKVVVKADTQGSVEAIVDSLKKIDSKKVNLEVIHNGVGSLTESDVMLASASNAVVIGFHTRLDTGVSEIAKRESVQIKLYSIIYELIDEIREAMAGLLDPVTKDSINGIAEIRKIFGISKGGQVAGCVISQGKFERGKARVYRDGNMIYEGATQSLRRFQDEVNEVRSGMECGIRLDHFNDFKEGDTIESYSLEEVAQEL
ncbi:MAG: Translation initiation factor IF-2 [Verrucomicrobia subdivision 3 bacterium]|nr:Translation initiation factor IF-2 [Limisphaerales bacterium]MCS1412961.1 Translation initiation factor IF-2 [Limisphaerales bacterium]